MGSGDIVGGRVNQFGENRTRLDLDPPKLAVDLSLPRP